MGITLTIECIHCNGKGFNGLDKCSQCSKGVILKRPANETPQLELLYRDIKIQMDELQEIRPYKAAVIEIIKHIAFSHYAEEHEEIKRILEKHNIKTLS